MQVVSSVDDPEEPELVEDSLIVDTSSWWEGYYDEEPEEPDEPKESSEF